MNNFILSLFIFFIPSAVFASGIYNPVTLSSTTLPSGSTQYIQNTNTLQSGATFYVSSGTVAGTFSLPSLTLGSIPFIGTAGLLTQDNTHLFWDNANKRLGINTASPGIPLDLSGSFRVGGVLTGTFPSAGEGFEAVYGSGSTGLDGVSLGESIFQSYSRDASAWKDIWMRGREVQFDVNGNQRMYLSNSADSFYLNGGVIGMIINATGVGFGASPSSPLDGQGLPSIDGATRSVERLIDNTGYGLGVGADISFWGRFSSGGSIGNLASVGGHKENATDGDYASYLNFITRVFGGSPTERMRISSAGNVGIGTSGPQTKLHLSSGVFTIDGNVSPSINAKDAIGLGSATKAGLAAKTPNKAGELWYCSDCANTISCISTGTVVGAYAAQQATNRTTACN